MPDHYYNLFWNSISILYEGGILTTAKSVEKFCNKLQLRGSYNRDKCLQGISEMVFGFMQLEGTTVLKLISNYIQK